MTNTRKQQLKEDMQAILTRSSTDLNFRERLISTPRAAAEEHTGSKLPEDFDVSFVESDADVTSSTAFSMVLPDYLGPEAELSKGQLEMVAGGDKFWRNAARKAGEIVRFYEDRVEQINDEIDGWF